MNIAFVFPGQGSQYVGMCREIYENFEVAREVFKEASDVLGYDVGSLSFEGPEEELNKTFRTQPCILTASIAIYKVLLLKDIRPSVVAGHSLGEYSAIVASGAMKFSDALRLTERRGQLMQDAVPEGKGLMAAILGLEKRQVEDICLSVKSGYVSPANYNCPGQIVISGERNAVEEAVKLSKDAGAKRTVFLSVSAPSHCRLMESASRALSNLIEEIEFKEPEIPIVNNVDAIFINNIDDIKSSLTRQLTRPLLWEDSIRVITERGIDTFIEVGPRNILTGLIKRIVPNANVLNVEDTKSLQNTIMKIKII